MTPEIDVSSSPLNTSDDITDNTDFVMEGQTVLILCGLIASGKSTFAEALQQYFPFIRRCNQDDLGDRRLVEQLARSTLAAGQSVCIDRTNFNAAQRSHWIEIAHEFPQIAIWVIAFDVPYEVCAERLRTRVNHPTITSVELGLDVLSRFSTDYEQPYPNEGYHRILHLKPEETSATYSRSDITAILRRVKDSPAVISSGPRFRASQRGQRGSYRGGNRGGPRGSYRGGYTPYQHQHSTRGRGNDQSAESHSNLRGRQTLSNRGNTPSTRGREQGHAPTVSESQSTSSEIVEEPAVVRTQYGVNNAQEDLTNM